MKSRILGVSHSAIVVAPHAGAWIEILAASGWIISISVAPHAGAWIEILGRGVFRQNVWVAPHAGAWIEIYDIYCKHYSKLSLLTQERGLKSPKLLILPAPTYVAPHAGAWIEINAEINKNIISFVAPHAGAWIEIKHQAN